MKNFVTLGMIGITAILSTTVINTCPITVINDTYYPIQIHTNDTSKPEFTLAPNQQQLFGGHDKHAEFSLIERNPSVRAESIIEIRQHSCSSTPVMLKASDLIAGKLDESLFNLDKTKNNTDQSAG